MIQPFVAAISALAGGMALAVGQSLLPSFDDCTGKMTCAYSFYSAPHLNVTWSGIYGSQPGLCGCDDTEDPVVCREVQPCDVGGNGTINPAPGLYVNVGAMCNAGALVVPFWATGCGNSDEISARICADATCSDCGFTGVVGAKCDQSAGCNYSCDDFRR